MLRGLPVLVTMVTWPLSRTRRPVTSSAHSPQCPQLAPGWEAVMLTVRETGPGQMELHGGTPTGAPQNPMATL